METSVERMPWVPKCSYATRAANQKDEVSQIQLVEIASEVRRWALYTSSLR